MKRILFIVIALLWILTGEVVDVTIVKDIYEIDNVMYYDIIQDNNLYEKIYVEDL